MVGNTGNAKHTPSHLHFGIYTYNGPVDPLPFINSEIKTASAVPEKSMKNALRLTKTQKSGTAVAASNTILTPLAVNSKGYVCEMPDGKLIQVPFSSVKIISNNDRDVLAERKTTQGSKG